MKGITRVKKRLASATTMVSNAINAMDIVAISYPDEHEHKEMAEETLAMLEKAMRNIDAMREGVAEELKERELW